MAEQLLSGRYQIVRHLARGGMAEVYLAHDELLDRPVAVKVLFPELARDASFVERFRREAQSAARLNHPNIVSVYDFGEDQDAQYIVMEYVEGQTLRDMIRAGGPMAPAEAIKIGTDIAAGLAVAHTEDIVHRDMKPANVLIAADGEGTAKVADFGIARAVGAGSDLTMPGSVVGTATYLSPEQAQGIAVDQRSDVYSLGMVMYEMLTGQAPFRGDNPLAIAYKQQHEVPPPPSAMNPAVSAQLDDIVARAMSLDPERRQRSAGEFRSELLALGQAPAGGDPTVAFMPPAETQIFPAAGRPAAGGGPGAGAGAAALAGIGGGGAGAAGEAVAGSGGGAGGGSGGLASGLAGLWVWVWVWVWAGVWVWGGRCGRGWCWPRGRRRRRWGPAWPRGRGWFRAPRCSSGCWFGGWHWRRERRPSGAYDATGCLPAAALRCPRSSGARSPRCRRARPSQLRWG